MLVTSSYPKIVECHIDLQNVVMMVSRILDIVVVCGFRNEKEQNDAFKSGRSKVSWPHGKHNKYPSEAIDIAPWLDERIPWKNEQLFLYLGGLVIGVAAMFGTKIRWGGDWDQKQDLNRKKGETLNDLCHFELVS